MTAAVAKSGHSALFVGLFSNKENRHQDEGLMTISGKNEKCLGLAIHYYDFLRGTFAPFLRASDNPIAIACFRLFTVPPFPCLPDFSVPCFFRRIALPTDLLAAFPYRAMAFSLSIR
ncbi:MAG TPA: hypothetical protein VGI16_10900 [Candidatus Acidoferrum sp.]|jgi:hypothetical protein